jgi:hypothetical protein
LGGLRNVPCPAKSGSEKFEADFGADGTFLRLSSTFLRLPSTFLRVRNSPLVKQVATVKPRKMTPTFDSDIGAADSTGMKDLYQKEAEAAIYVGAVNATTRYSKSETRTEHRAQSEWCEV